MKLRTIFHRLFSVIDCLNTIYDMQNEIEYLNHCNDILQNLDTEKLFWKILYAFLVSEILNKNISSYLIDWNKVFLLV